MVRCLLCKKVIIIKTKGNWSLVQDPINNKKGWVHQSLLSTYKNTSYSISNSGGSSSGSLNTNSSIKIIEDRMREKGLYDKWVKFKTDNSSIKKYYVSDINIFVNKIESYMGVPYKYGGTSRSGIDCSGLVNKGLQSVGYSGKRLNAERFAKLGRFIAYKKSLKRGDLVFFKTSSKLVSHVGVYAGNGQFIHAPSSGGHVSKANVDDPYYWSERFLFGVRLTKN